MATDDELVRGCGLTPCIGDLKCGKVMAADD